MSAVQNPTKHLHRRPPFNGASVAVSLLLSLLPVHYGCGTGAPATSTDQPAAAAGETSDRAAQEPDHGLEVADDWPRLYGPNGDCTSDEWIRTPERAESSPTFLWSVAVGSGYSAPVVSRNQVILQHRSGDHERVTCYGAECGAIIWEQQFPTAFQCAWPSYSSGPYSTPLIHQGAIYVLSAEGVLRRLALEDGALVWERNLERDFEVPRYGYGAGHSPAIWKDTLIINAGGSKPNSGVVGNRILVASFRADTFLVDVSKQGSPQIVWRNPRALGSVFQPLTFHNGNVLGWHSFDRTLRSINFTSGQLRWKQRTAFERGHHILARDHLLVLGETGLLGVMRLSADKAELCWRSSEPVLRGPCYTMPALAHGRLFVRDEHQLRCCDFLMAEPESNASSTQ